MSYSILITIAGIVVCAQLTLVFARLLLTPLRSLPGPFLARFTDAWYFWQVRKAHFEEDNLALHEKYGKLEKIIDRRHPAGHQRLITPKGRLFGMAQIATV